MKLPYSIIFFGIIVFTVSCNSSAHKVNLSDPHFVNGGRAVAVTFDPEDKNNVWVATPTGGLYKSSNGGSGWNKVEEMSEFGCYDIQFCPSDPDIIIATCIEDTKVHCGGGVWLSRDKGMSWFQPASAKVHISKKQSKRYSAYGISFMPNSQTVVVGTDSGIVVSKDLGNTWKHINPPGDNRPNRFFSVLALRNGKLVASGDAGVWVSDFSQTIWTRDNNGLVNDIQVKNSLAAAPVDDNTFGKNVLFFTGDQNHKLMYSLDDGLNWKNIDVNFSRFNRANTLGTWRIPYVKVVKSLTGKPGEWDLYFSDLAVVGSKKIIWRSGDFDFAVLWRPVMFNHSDPSDIVFDSYNNTDKNIKNHPLYATNDGGVERSSDGGFTWEQVGTPNNHFSAFQVYDVKCVRSADGPSVTPDLFFGTQDNSIYGSIDNGVSWPRFWGDEGGNFQCPLVKPSGDQPYPLTILDGAANNFLRCNPELSTCDPISYPIITTKGVKQNAIYAAGNNRYVALGQGKNQITQLFISTDNCASWTSAQSLLNLTQNNYIYSFISGYSIISGGGHLSIIAAYTTSSAGVSLSPSSWGLVRINDVFNTSNGNITYDLIALPAGCVLGTYGFQFRESIASFGVDPWDPDFIILPDIHDDKIYISKEGGWEIRQDIMDLVTDNGKFAFNLPDSHRSEFELSTSQVSCISFDPFNHNYILIGTAEAGVILSSDHGQTWKKVRGSEQIPNITSFSFGDGEAFASSWGGSIWRIPLD